MKVERSRIEEGVLFFGLGAFKSEDVILINTGDTNFWNGHFKYKENHYSPREVYGDIDYRFYSENWSEDNSAKNIMHDGDMSEDQKAEYKEIGEYFRSIENEIVIKVQMVFSLSGNHEIKIEDKYTTKGVFKDVYSLKIECSRKSLEYYVDSIFKKKKILI